ncbi:hypothetical protein CYMTET_54714 [Cymbomonas tetramitiformis]|uniref:Uncharacterized protein n=1 Tax=Cymbomonas tetramitiformis TaxID=36881 RepID=A0AAE0BEL9_9CHLO|nr:hypothetical protein CYMTET_54714 [Cymbomonas tetramitiformis]
MSRDELAAFELRVLRLLPQLSSVEAMGRAKTRLLLSDLGILTSFDKLRFDVGVQDELFESKVALFKDAYELTGWQQRSISPFNFNDSELVPFMNEAVKHLVANPVVPLPTNWGSTSGDGATLSLSILFTPKAKPGPYVPPHNRSGKISGDKKVVAKVIERHHHHHHSGHPSGKKGRGRRARNARAAVSGGARKGAPDFFGSPSSPSPSFVVTHSEEPCDYAQEQCAIDTGSEYSEPYGYEEGSSDEYW